MEQEGRSCVVFIFITKINYKSMAYLALSLSESEVKVIRKVTTRTTGLWPPSVHNHVFFCNVDDVVVITV